MIEVNNTIIFLFAFLVYKKTLKYSNQNLLFVCIQVHSWYLSGNRHQDPYLVGFPFILDKIQPLNSGPFQGHVCEQNSGKFHFWMATAPGTNMQSTIFDW